MRYVCLLAGLALAAPWLYPADAHVFTAAQKNWWAFQPVKSRRRPR